MRTVIAALVVVGLTIAVILLWPSATADIPPDTLAAATTTTTSTMQTTATTTSATTTTSLADDDSHVVETVEEAEEILRELWFGWFEGIYNEDEDRIREVVVLEETVEQARQSFGVTFERQPEPGDITFDESEILRSDQDCLAVLTTLRLSGFQHGESRAVEILRWTSEGWKSLSTWVSSNDLWEEDCDSSLPS